MKAKINDILPDKEVFTLVDGDPKKQKISGIVKHILSKKIL